MARRYYTTKVEDRDPWRLEPLPSNICSTRRSPLSRIYEVLGASSKKLPKNFRGKFNVDGHTVVVFPSLSMPKSSATRYGRAYKRKTVSGRKYGLSRVFFLISGRLIPVGRVKQSKFCGGKGGRWNQNR